MRKDVKLGLAVGAILAVVIFAYAVFFNRNPEKPKEVAVNPSALPEPERRATPAPPPSRVEPPPGRIETPPRPEPRAHVEIPDPVPPPVDAGSERVTRIAPPSDSGQMSTWEEFLRRGDPTGSLISRTETPSRGGSNTPERSGDDSGNSSRSADTHSGNGGGSTGNAGGTTPPPDPSAPRKYVVQSGDSYWSISQKEFGSGAYVAHLMRANPNFPPNKLRPGVSLIIPAKNEVVPEDHAPRPPTPVTLDPARQYKVVQGDNLTVISKKLYGNISKIDAIYEANKNLIGPNRSALKLGMILALPEPPTASASVN